MMFEPYLVVHRRYVPLYDEFFEGRMMNKISHIYQVHEAGWVSAKQKSAKSHKELV